MRSNSSKLLSLAPACTVSLGASAQEWPHVGGDAGRARHSTLSQINKGNVSELELAWSFDTGDRSEGTKLPTLSACLEQVHRTSVARSSPMVASSSSPLRATGVCELSTATAAWSCGAPGSRPVVSPSLQRSGVDRAAGSSSCLLPAAVFLGLRTSPRPQTSLSSWYAAATVRKRSAHENDQRRLGFSALRGVLSHGPPGR